ncbi:MAG: precorrin-8X methylmutase [Dethiobacteria bacterium]|jgi:precorrin-8X/cobalt-precorrin-8 methylmutase
MNWQMLAPEEIEKRSFEIISREMGEISVPEGQAAIVKRVIHATADFDYINNLFFSENAVEAGLEALQAGAHIVADTRMVEAGINKKALAALGGALHCFMADADVAVSAKKRGITRASVSMEKACALRFPLIIAVGNAPTALLSLSGLIRAGRILPRLVIGVPVGFVNVVESKELIKNTGVPCIIADGRKGGSTVAAAICNALLYKLTKRR